MTCKKYFSGVAWAAPFFFNLYCNAINKRQYKIIICKLIYIKHLTNYLNNDNIFSDIRDGTVNKP